VGTKRRKGEESLGSCQAQGQCRLIRRGEVRFHFTNFDQKCRESRVLCVWGGVTRCFRTVTSVACCRVISSEPSSYDVWLELSRDSLLNTLPTTMYEAICICIVFVSDSENSLNNYTSHCHQPPRPLFKNSIWTFVRCPKVSPPERCTHRKARCSTTSQSLVTETEFLSTQQPSRFGQGENHRPRRISARARPQ
jgi:hypothetical protein